MPVELVPVVEPALTEPPAGVRAVLAMPILYFVHPGTMDSLWRAAARYGRDQLAFDSEEGTDIDRARNLLADRALKRTPRPDYLIFVDHDTGVPVGDPKWYRARFEHDLPDRYGAHNFFHRLLGHSPDMGIVSGSYMERKEDGEAVCSLGKGRQRPGYSALLRKGLVRSVQPCDWVGFGAVRVAMWVFDRLLAEKHRWPGIIPKLVEGKPPKPVGFFTRLSVDSSEDASFCLRAKQISIQTYVDTELRLVHTGKKHFV